MSISDNVLLNIISKEISERFKCEVISISLCEIIGTPNVLCKIKYNDDFVYNPCEHFTPKTICFSERTVTFFRRIDYFESVKNLARQN